MSLNGPTNQPPVQPQPSGMEGYPPPGQPGAAGYAPAAFAPPPKKGFPPKVLAIIVIGIVLTLGIPGFFILNVHGGSGGGLFVDRHGMPGNVPLPNGATFKLMKDDSNSSGSSKSWYWTVDSPNTPSTMRNFYQSNFPSNGWTVAKTLGGGDDFDVIGCQGNQMAYVSMASFPIDVFGAKGSDPRTISAPSGGSALRIIVNSQPESVSAYCK